VKAIASGCRSCQRGGGRWTSRTVRRYPAEESLPQSPLLPIRCWCLLLSSLIARKMSAYAGTTRCVKKEANITLPGCAWFDTSFFLFRTPGGHLWRTVPSASGASACTYLFGWASLFAAYPATCAACCLEGHANSSGAWRSGSIHIWCWHRHSLAGRLLLTSGGRWGTALYEQTLCAWAACSWRYCRRAIWFKRRVRCGNIVTEEGDERLSG